MSALTDSILKGSATKTPTSTGGSSLVSQILSAKTETPHPLIQNPDVMEAIRTFAPNLLTPNLSVGNTTATVGNGSTFKDALQAIPRSLVQTGIGVGQVFNKSTVGEKIPTSNFGPVGEALFGKEPLQGLSDTALGFENTLKSVGIPSPFATPLAVAGTAALSVADYMGLGLSKRVAEIAAGGLKAAAVREVPAVVELPKAVKPSVVARPTAPVPVTETIPQTARLAPKVEGNATSKVGKSIETGAIEKKLTEGFGGTAGYDKIVVKEQAKNVADLVNKDINAARAMVRGEVPLPENIRGASLITGMEDYAVKNGDASILRELAQSPLASETSRSAQELRLLAERSPDSPVTAMTDIAKAREAMISKRYGNLEKAKEKVSVQIKKEIAKARTKETWESFITSIQC